VSEQLVRLIKKPGAMIFIGILPSTEHQPPDD
jgi:hypothetical protein